MTIAKKILIFLLTTIILIAGNVVLWVTSDIQQRCYNKIENKIELNLYEKCSVYSLNLCICTFGWILSPEATRQQIWCTIPTKDTIVRHSKHFSNDEYIKSLIKKNPNATISNPTRIAWKASNNQFGLYSAYNRNNMRSALACNGVYLYKEDGYWVISNIKEYAFPNLSTPTIIGPFKFHEGLIRYLQDIGWLHKPHFKWILKV